MVTNRPAILSDGILLRTCRSRFPPSRPAHGTHRPSPAAPLASLPPSSPPCLPRRSSSCRQQCSICGWRARRLASLAGARVAGSRARFAGGALAASPPSPETRVACSRARFAGGELDSPAVELDSRKRARFADGQARFARAAARFASDGDSDRLSFGALLILHRDSVPWLVLLGFLCCGERHRCPDFVPPARASWSEGESATKRLNCRGGVERSWSRSSSTWARPASGRRRTRCSVAASGSLVEIREDDDTNGFFS
jgi:hypothetical protein